MNRQRFFAGYAYSVGLLGWITLLLQFRLHLRAAPGLGIPPGMAVLNFFSYFTILSNLFAALALTAPRFWPGTRMGRFFAHSNARNGIAVCMAVVGIVYSLVLRATWNPQGLQRTVDHLLHDALPLLFLIYWAFAVPGKSWSSRGMLRGAAFPLAYLLHSLVRGAIDGWYPYPFLNAGMLGYPRVLLNGVGVLVLFSAVALLLFGLDRLKGRLQPA